ncbi:MAG: class I SAM-dependent methyltransferase [Patescibacteria group bacterium]
MPVQLEKLVFYLEQKGILKSENIARALGAVDRIDFVPEDLKELAYEDDPLPLGYEQTISQPHTVVFMLEILDVKVGQKIMDIGYGSGWQSALLANLVGEKGKIYAFEIVPQLCQIGKDNVKKYKELYHRVKFFCQNAKHGYEKESPFDRIIVAATLSKVPQEWRRQLKVGGKIVYPLHNSIYLEEKTSDKLFIKKEYPDFVFVPFVS